MCLNPVLSYFLTHGHSIIRKSCPVLIFLVHFFFCPDKVFNKVDGQGRNDHVEVLQVGVLVAVELFRKNVDQKLKKN